MPYLIKCIKKLYEHFNFIIPAGIVISLPLLDDSANQVSAKFVPSKRFHSFTKWNNEMKWNEMKWNEISL